MRIDMFVIDGQNDFCASGNEPADWPCPEGGRRQGALFVEGADKEALLVEEMLNRLEDPKVMGGHKINKLHPSLDSHHRNDCSHNTSWKRPDGSSPPPFTIVTLDDIKRHECVPRFAFGVWNGTTIPSYQWALNYVEELAATGRCPLCLWPPHCEIGKWGQNTYYPLQRAYDRWCAVTGGYIDFITKGQWPWTEHYSALRADVPDPKRLETQMNAEVVKDASQADIIVWAGWAGSHCTRWTALDAINYFGAGENSFIKKCVFLEDACAAVANPPNGPDFAQWRIDFLDEVRNRGAKVMKTTEFLT